MAVPPSAANVVTAVPLREAKGGEIRVLVALEDNYRAYRETIAAVLAIMRPEMEVQSTNLEALEMDLERFDPEVVICAGHKDVEPGTRLAWIELSIDPTLPSRIRVGGRCFERINPNVEELLEIIDEVGGAFSA